MSRCYYCGEKIGRRSRTCAYCRHLKGLDPFSVLDCHDAGVHTEPVIAAYLREAEPPDIGSAA